MVPPESSFYRSWEEIPENSIDLVWGQACPCLGPFMKDHISNVLESGDSEEYLLDPFWWAIFTHGKRILRENGKIVLPLPIVYDELLTDELSVKLLLRIINVAVDKDNLYKYHVISPFDEKHTKLLKNLVLLDKENLNSHKRTSNDQYPETVKYIVLEKPATA